MNAYKNINYSTKSLKNSALLAKCFNERQRSQAILHSIRNQPWYEPRMASLHQKTLLDGEMLLQKTKALHSRTQDYLDSLQYATVPALEQVKRFNEEAQVLSNDLKRISRSYQLLMQQAQLTPDHADEQFLTSANLSLINLEEIFNWVREMRQKSDPVYQQLSQTYELIERISKLHNAVIGS